MANTALAKINRRIKQLKKKHPGSSHKSLQKKAGVEYRAGKLGGVKKKKSARRVVHKKAGKRKHAVKRKVGAVRRSNGKDRTDNKRVSITVGTIGRTETQLKNMLAEKIGWLEAQKMHKTTKKDRSVLQKKINALKTRYNRLK